MGKIRLPPSSRKEFQVYRGLLGKENGETEVRLAGLIPEYKMANREEMK